MLTEVPCYPRCCAFCFPHRCLRTEPRSPECAAAEFPWPVCFMNNCTGVQDRKPISRLQLGLESEWCQVGTVALVMKATVLFSLPLNSHQSLPLKNRNNDSCEGSCRVLSDDVLCHVISMFGNLFSVTGESLLQDHELRWRGWGVHTGDIPWHPWSDLEFFNFSWCNAWQIETRLQMFELGSSRVFMTLGGGSEPGLPGSYEITKGTRDATR